MATLWSKSPFLRLLWPLVAGVVWQVMAPLPAVLVWCMLLVMVLLHLLFHFLWVPKFTFRNRYWIGVEIHVLGICLGLGLTQAAYSSAMSRHYSQAIEHTNALLVQIREIPLHGARSMRCKAEVKSLMVDGKWQASGGLVQLYLAPGEAAPCLDQLIVIPNKLTRIEGPSNPMEFNYQRYAAFHHLYHTAYLQQGEWLAAGMGAPGWRSPFIRLREWLLQQFRNYDIDGDELAVLSALVLGKTSELDSELLTAYASAGAVHVLAVSGLHVGLIGYALLWLTSLRKKVKQRTRWSILVSVMFIWVYAALTGFSPSVLRASLMFTIMIGAGLFNRQAFVFNTLAASAFILLAIHPYLITEVGFQLSYLAVGGIVLLHRRLYGLLHFKYRVFDWAWQLTCVSLAAQLATFPLGMLYYHQFPNYFLISNLVIIPVATLALYTSIFFFALVWYEPLAQLAANVAMSLIHTMNEVVQEVEKWPASIIRGIHISVLDTWIIMALVATLCSWFFGRRPVMFLLALSCAVLLAVSSLISAYTLYARPADLVIHRIRGHEALTYRSGRDVWFLYSDSLNEQTSAMRFHVSNFLEHLHARVHMVSLDSSYHSADGQVLCSAGIAQLGDVVLQRLRDGDSLAPFAQLVLITRGRNFFGKEVPTVNTPWLILEDTITRRNRHLAAIWPAQRLRSLHEGALVWSQDSLVHFTEVYR